MSDIPDATDANGSDTSNGDDEAAPSGEQAVDPLEAAKAEAKKNLDGWKRSAADFDNFRKRSRKEIEDTRKAGREDLLKDFLPVFDNLERAITSAQRATELKPVLDGLAMVLKQYIDTLGRSGITKVPGVGSTFDPMVHEAIQQVESEEHPPGTIVAEVQPGYLNGERLVRAAMVVVAKAKAVENSDDGSAGEGKTDDAKEGDSDA
jgi:molecular chaperone GrpE